MKVKIKMLSPDAKIPQKAHDDDFCYDVWAVSEEEVAPNVWKYGLGFSLQIEDYKQHCACGFKLFPRSSIWKTGMILSNSVGVVDEGYTGEISAVFYHVIPNMPRYKVGDKIAQLHLDWSNYLGFKKTDELSKTDRGVGGYGSTGK